MMASNTSGQTQNKLISIIIPVFNRSETLPRLFSSLRKISYTPLEIILVDNGSIDNSLDLCLQYQKETVVTAQIEVLVDQELKQGACACRNHGLELAHGDFVYFFDSDDEISPDFFTDLSSYCQHYDAICAPTRMRFEDGTTKVRACVPTANPYDQIISASISTQSLLVSRKFIRAIGGWNENLFRWNDWELGVRLLCHQPKVKWLSHKAYHTIYQHSKSISGNSFTEDYQKLVKTLEQAATDVNESRFSVSDKNKSKNALSAKCLLLAANIYKEGHADLSHAAYLLSRQYAATATFRRLSPLVFILAKHGCPGAWRLFRKII